MSAPIDEQVVRHIARLARLELSDAEVARYTRELAEVVAYMDQLSTIDTAEVVPTAHPLEVSNVWRDDEPRTPLGAAAALSNAPRAESGYFALPKVLDQQDA
ncbi:MAG: Asp-tRNA(Asn)/Glu-tRNA(Gln) amidotransferase subunit GatC [Phycisphaerae bacterium]